MVLLLSQRGKTSVLDFPGCWTRDTVQAATCHDASNAAKPELGTVSKGSAHPPTVLDNCETLPRVASKKGSVSCKRRHLQGKSRVNTTSQEEDVESRTSTTLLAVSCV
eukprot:657961-Amphidinium_carterae.1